MEVVLRVPLTAVVYLVRRRDVMNGMVTCVRRR